MIEKECTQCKRELPDFYFAKNGKGHLSSACKACQKVIKSVGSIPVWVDKDAMVRKYLRAIELTHETGVLHTVDHIVPKKGILVNIHLVCGLHCEDNLEVMTMTENSKKGKTNWEDMPDCPPSSDRKARLLWRKKNWGSVSRA